MLQAGSQGRGGLAGHPRERKQHVQRHWGTCPVGMNVRKAVRTGQWVVGVSQRNGGQRGSQGDHRKAFLSKLRSLNSIPRSVGPGRDWTFNKQLQPFVELCPRWTSTCHFSLIRVTFGIDSDFNTPSPPDIPGLIHITQTPNHLPGNKGISPHKLLYPHKHPLQLWIGDIRTRST